MGFANTAPVSGGSISNIQNEVNSIDSFIGKVSNIAPTALPPWNHNDIGTSTDPLFQRLDAITLRFSGTTGIGHQHSGADGDGAPISLDGISNNPPTPSDVNSIAIIGATGNFAWGSHIHRGIRSIAVSGSSAAFGDITLVAGSGINLTPSSGGNIITFAASGGGGGGGNLTVDTFSGNGSTTGFTLSVNPGSIDNTWVFISGVYQEKATYSVSGTSLTFTTAPPTGTNNIEVVSGTTLSIGTPANGTVTFASLASGFYVSPTVQIFTSGSGTYTRPSSPRAPLYLKVTSLGGGGGGGGGGTGGGGGSNGQNSSFGSTLVVGSLGSGGSGSAGAGGAGGSASTAGPAVAIITATGGSGQGGLGANTASVNPHGGQGGTSAFGGTGGGGQASNAGQSAPSTTGGGGGGGGATATNGGAGGGAGGCAVAIISSPSSTYSYSVGAGGGGGSAGTGGFAGGNGGSGIIIIEEFYQ